ncbi:transposase [Streptomyces microflavus]|uniref:transposase n=1 Tax=Streptomyces microflavus TaxID=1919 RepID=UPI003652016C
MFRIRGQGPPAADTPPTATSAPTHTNTDTTTLNSHSPRDQKPRAHHHGGRPVHLVCDNNATHNTAEIRTWLAKHPRFYIHYTPTGSSWMNQVERWFGLPTDKLIRRSVHTSVKALEDNIRAWIETWNQDPRPFT